jgi:hypothetical protein
MKKTATILGPMALLAGCATTGPFPSRPDQLRDERTFVGTVNMSVDRAMNVAPFETSIVGAYLASNDLTLVSSQGDEDSQPTGNIGLSFGWRFARSFELEGTLLAGVKTSSYERHGMLTRPDGSTYAFDYQDEAGPTVSAQLAAAWHYVLPTRSGNWGVFVKAGGAYTSASFETSFSCAASCDDGDPSDDGGGTYESTNTDGTRTVTVIPREEFGIRRGGRYKASDYSPLLGLGIQYRNLRVTYQTTRLPIPTRSGNEQLPQLPAASKPRMQTLHLQWVF